MTKVLSMSEAWGGGLVEAICTTGTALISAADIAAREAIGDGLFLVPDFEQSEVAGEPIAYEMTAAQIIEAQRILAVDISELSS